MKKFENFLKEDGKFSIYDFKNHLLNNYSKENVDLDLIKKYTDKFVGSGFYEELYEYSTHLYNSLKKSINNLDLLEGLLETRFESVMNIGDELRVYSGVSYYSDTNKEEYNGTRFFRKDNLSLDSIICFILNELVNRSISGGIRKTHDSLFVTDEEWNILNMPKNRYLYSTDNKDVFEYIRNFNMKNRFIPTVTLEITNDRSYSLKSIKKCNDIFEKCFKLIRRLISSDVEVIDPMSHKYHSQLSEYKKILKIV